MTAPELPPLPPLPPLTPSTHGRGANQRCDAYFADSVEARERILLARIAELEGAWPDKPTPAMCDALRIGSRRDVPGDELCAVRYAALRLAAIAAMRDEKGGGE